MTIAIGFLMIHKCMVVYRLPVANNGYGIHVALCMFSTGIKVQVIADQFSTERIRSYMDVACFFLHHMGIVHQRCFITIILYFVIAHARITSGEDLTYKICKARLVANVLMTLHNLNFRILFYDD